MKGMILMIFVFCIWTASASGQVKRQNCASIGIDLISAICFQTARMNVSYNFSSNWSAGGDIGLNLGNMKKGMKEIDRSHMENLSYGQSVPNDGQEFRKSFMNICLHIDYWPRKAFHGPYLRIGGKFQDRGHPDCIAGIGYCATIWHRLGVNFACQIGIAETIAEQKFLQESIHTGIYYIF